MKEIKVFGHGPYVGTTGYNNHTRDFFRGYQNIFLLSLETIL